MIRIQLAGQFHHPFGDIDAADAAEARTQRPRDAPNPAAKVECSLATSGHIQLLGRGEHRRHGLLGGSEKLVELPQTMEPGRIAEDSPERIDILERFPVPLLPRTPSRTGQSRPE